MPSVPDVQVIVSPTKDPYDTRAVQQRVDRFTDSTTTFTAVSKHLPRNRRCHLFVFRDGVMVWTQPVIFEARPRVIKELKTAR